MFKEDLPTRQDWTAWSCMIPAEDIKIVDLNLGPDENGTCTMTKKQEEAPVIVPITMRKYLRYRLFLVS